MFVERASRPGRAKRVLRREADAANAAPRWRQVFSSLLVPPLLPFQLGRVGNSCAQRRLRMQRQVYVPTDSCLQRRRRRSLHAAQAVPLTLSQPEHVRLSHQDCLKPILEKHKMCRINQR